jgi:hypothetical protein
MSATLEWSEREPGVFSRTLDDLELFYTWVGTPRSKENKQNWYMSSGIKLEIQRPNLVEATKTAWLEIRRRYPNIAAKVENGVWIYRVASDQEECKTWLEETFHVHRVPFTARELWSEPDVQPSTRITIHVLPNTQEILIRGPHLMLDGFLSMKILRTVMEILGNPPDAVRFGDEARDLQMPLAVNCRTPPYTAAQGAQWQSILDEWAQAVPTTHLQTTNQTQPPGCSRSQWLVFDAEDTRQIQNALRKLGISLAGATQAALSLAARKHGTGEDKYNSHATFGLYSAREFVQASITPSEIIVPHVLGVPVVIPLRSTFIETARDAGKALQDAKGIDDFALAVSPLWTSDLPKLLAKPLPDDSPMPADVQLSYMGPLDSHLPKQVQDHVRPGEDIRCLDWWAALDMVGANVVCPTVVFQGQLRFSLGYNEVYHSKESMKHFLGLVGKQLSDGLKLNLFPSACVPGDEDWLVKFDDED